MGRNASLMNDQDVIKSYSSHICHTPSKEYAEYTEYTEFPLPFSNFSISSFLGIFGKVNPSPPPKKKKKKGGGVNYGKIANNWKISA